MFLALASCEMAMAQKASDSRSPASFYYIDTVKAEVHHSRFTLPAQYTLNDITTGLVRYFPALAQPYITLKQVKVTESPLGKHILFQPLYRGIPVYHSEVRVHIDRNQQVYLLSAVLFPVHQDNWTDKDFTIQAAAWCRQWYNEEPQGLQRVIYYDGNRSQVAVKFNFRNRQQPQRPELVVAENGNILYRQNLAIAFTNMPDSMVSGYIFRPDPLTTAQKFYGSPYTDSSDFTNSHLDSQRVMVRFKAAYTNDSFRLQSRLFRLVDFIGSSVKPVIKADTLLLTTAASLGLKTLILFTTSLICIAISKIPSVIRGCLIHCSLIHTAKRMITPILIPGLNPIHWNLAPAV